jgi:uncharacterized protein
VKLAVEEPESESLVRAVTAGGPHLTSVIGEIEFRRVCLRAGVPRAQVDDVMAGVELLALSDEIRGLAAALGPPLLRTLDAIHLATAISARGDLEKLLTYDVRLAAAAAQHGLEVLAPR